MKNGYLDRNTPRKDKANTCIVICFYIEQHGHASKSILAEALKRPYSRISNAVDYLYSIKTLDKYEAKGFSTVKPGKREIFYRLTDQKWLNRIIFNIHSKPLVKKLAQLENIMKEIRQIEHDTYPLWLKSASKFEWPKDQMKKWQQESPDEVAARCIANSILATFGQEKIKSLAQKNLWDWLENAEIKLQDAIVENLRELQLLS